MNNTGHENMNFEPAKGKFHGMQFEKIARGFSTKESTICSATFRVSKDKAEYCSLSKAARSELERVCKGFNNIEFLKAGDKVFAIKGVNIEGQKNKSSYSCSGIREMFDIVVGQTIKLEFYNGMLVADLRER